MNVFDIKAPCHRTWLSFAIAVAVAALGSGAEANEKKKESRPLQNSEIAAAIREEISTDRAMDATELEIAVEEGTVTLTGSAPHIMAKERATTIAEIVKGTRSVVNRIKVNPATDISPHALTENIQYALVVDPATEEYEIEVDAQEGGIVTLTGQVDSWQEKQLAANVAKGIRGVTELRNNIEVNYSAVRPDRQIEAEIEGRLRWDALVDHSLIEVAVKDQQVKLSGVVGSVAEKRRAIDDARVAGVIEVDGELLEVARWARDEDLRRGKYAVESDEQIAQAIARELAHHPRVEAGTVQVDVSLKTATLTGFVESLAAKEAAETVARNTTGVESVHNELQVESAQAVDSAKAQENIATRLKTDPWLSDYGLNIDVEDGIATLTGVVDMKFEKFRAESLAQTATGVQEVRNRIRVVNTDSNVLYDPYIWSQYPTPWAYYAHPPMQEARDTAADTGPSDDEIRERIQKQLYWSPYINNSDVTIFVNDGTATLVGTVQSQKEKEAATRSAYAGGAQSVENEIDVES